MSNLVVHFEIHGSDPPRLADFYGRLLGWSFSAVRRHALLGHRHRRRVRSMSGRRYGHGINGGLTQRQGPGP